MWVTTTCVSCSGSTPARRSFCTGLPPQSTRIAPSSPVNTSDVVSRVTDGTAPELPRNVTSMGRSMSAGSIEKSQHLAEIALEARPQVLSLVVVVDLREQLDAPMPLEVSVRHVPRRARPIRLEEHPRHRLHHVARAPTERRHVRIPVLDEVQVDEEARDILQRIAEHEVVEVPDDDAPVAQVEVLAEEVAVN